MFVHKYFELTADRVVALQANMIRDILHSTAVEPKAVWFEKMIPVTIYGMLAYTENETERQFLMYILGVLTEGPDNLKFWIGIYKDAYDPDPTNTLINLVKLMREDLADQTHTIQSN